MSQSIKKRMFHTLLKDNRDYQLFLSQFKIFLKNYLKEWSCLPFKGHKVLRDSIEYSLFSNGKHFRPLLVRATAQWLDVPTGLILPWAGALEMAHVASLIHDDLPCMDNSPQRRGRPANHRVFGEDIALLAGNSLWVESFHLIVRKAEPKQAQLWLPILSKALGFNGLMGGQALDITPPLNQERSKQGVIDYYEHTHLMKTGSLISACMEGVATLPFVHQKEQEVVKELAHLIGRAFQLADDIQDVHTEKTASNVAHVIGRDSAQNRLLELSDKALSLLDFKDEPHSKKSSVALKELIMFNKNRALSLA